MNKGQQSLLMFLETRIVDHAGKVAGAHMNGEDFDQAQSWREEGLIKFGRIPTADINRPQIAHRSGTNTNWVRFTDEAWKLAHRFRRERGDRLTAEEDKPVEKEEER